MPGWTAFARVLHLCNRLLMPARENSCGRWSTREGAMSERHSMSGWIRAGIAGVLVVGAMIGGALMGAGTKMFTGGLTSFAGSFGQKKPTAAPYSYEG